MYQIKCDGHVLYDPRDDDLTVKSPKCKLAINTVGSASFAILSKHPHYKDLIKLKSVFEISQDNDVIFRGRMTEDSKDFHNQKLVDLEGAMAYFNDSMVRPFAFPDDYINDPEYEHEIRTGGNIVKYFFSKLIQNHNSQVEPFQEFKVGRVTVSDPNNYITRSDSGYKKTWEILKEKLFESSLGGYLCIRYEDDGNYIDYLSEFDTDNTQKIRFGENILDLSVDSDATETYSAIIPLGAESPTTGEKLTISSLDDDSIPGGDIVRRDDTLYSISAVEKFGWIYAPVSDTTWDDVTTPEALQNRGVDYIKSKASKFWETLSIKAIDLHLSNQEIEAFRIYKNVYVESTPHEQSGKNKLSELDIDIENPQNTQITVGEKKRVLTERTKDALQRVENIKNDSSASNKELSGKINETNQKLANVSQSNKELANAIEDKVGKEDDSQVVTMINRAKETVEFLLNRLVIESTNFSLSEEGSVVANDITLKSSKAENAVEIKEGTISVNSPAEQRGEGADDTARELLLLKFQAPMMGSAEKTTYGLFAQGHWNESDAPNYPWIPSQLVFREI